MVNKPLPSDPLPLNLAARCLRVPARWLRDEIAAGHLPGLNAGQSVLVHVPTVAAKLAERAKGKTEFQAAEPANLQGAIAAPLALRPAQAAQALGLSGRKLWELSQPRGTIPCVRVGSCVLYPRDLLQAWLNEQVAKEGGR